MGPCEGIVVVDDMRSSSIRSSFNMIWRLSASLATSSFKKRAWNAAEEEDRANRAASW